jgi:hypothetical protein
MCLKLGLSLQGRTQNLRFKNRVLRRISGPKKEEVTGGSLPQIDKDKMDETHSMHG